MICPAGYRNLGQVLAPVFHVTHSTWRYYFAITLAANVRKRSATRSGVSPLLIKASAPADSAACWRASRWLMRIMTSAAGQAFRSLSRAAVGELGSRSQSTSSMSVCSTGAWANVVDQSAASPTTSIFRSRSMRRRAERSCFWESAKYTRVMPSSYNKHSPATSNGWGVFFSATWGR
jgi:hypothetical protein